MNTYQKVVLVVIRFMAIGYLFNLLIVFIPLLFALGSPGGVASPFPVLTLVMMIIAVAIYFAAPILSAIITRGTD